MTRQLITMSLILAAIVGLAAGGSVLATPSSGLEEIDGDLFDDWKICRTRAQGEDGFYQITRSSFRPVIALESLGENAHTAYDLGRQFKDKYPDPLPRARAIFSFVRDRVNYTPDIDQFRHDEFAQNADELAIVIREKGVGYGDCEDTAVLLAVMYKGAGQRSAIAVGPGHTAALVYLPEYQKTPTAFELDGEPGWVWCEATGRNNPMGWIPKESAGSEFAAYEITEDEAITSAEPPSRPSTAVARTGGGGSSSQPFPFFGIMLLFWLIPLFRRRRAR
ncbi:MAG: transglutaminase domain-containing protein [Chloroflexota bacterium]